MNSRSTVAQKASLSEYTHSELPAQYAPEPNTLFDEDTFKEVEHIVDTRNVPYAEARTIVGAETPFYETPVNPELDPNPGVYVQLGTRALALQEIMSTYNYISRVDGVHKKRTEPGNDFDRRYANPDAVVANMDSKATMMRRDIEKYYAVLNATDALVDAGYDQGQGNEGRALRQEKQMRIALIDTYGPGNKGDLHAYARKKLVKNAMKVAGKVQ